MKKITKGIILAGGLGTRLQPLTKDVPKEMLPLGTRPILEHIVEELRAAGLEELIIVTREEKQAIADRFAGERDVRIVTKKEALGPGHSVLCAREFLEGHGFALAFGDAPLHGPHAGELVPCMIGAHESLGAACVIAVQRTPKDETHLRGIIEPECELTPGVATLVAGLHQKPDPDVAPSDWAAAGRFVYGPTVFKALDTIRAGARGEILLADALKHMLHEGEPVYAIALGKGQRRFDTGTVEGYAEALEVFKQGES
jgi:UTP--glucose-1-phosphate uridylyltransferase